VISKRFGRRLASDWVLVCVENHLCGDAAAHQRLEAWLADWVVYNALYKGPNWKCGEEASIRLMHLALAAQMLRGAQSSIQVLLQLIQAHLLRIAPTLQYAMA
jgi:hypothetical protein